MRFFQPAYCRFLGNKEIRILRFLHNNSAALTVIRSSRPEVFYKKGEKNKERERQRQRQRETEREREREIEISLGSKKMYGCCTKPTLTTSLPMLLFNIPWQLLCADMN